MVANPRLRARIESQKDRISPPKVSPSQQYDQQWPVTPKWRPEMNEMRPLHTGSLFAMNALDEDCKIRDGVPSFNDKLQAMLQNWRALSDAEREEFLQATVGGSSTARDPSRGNVDRNIAAVPRPLPRRDTVVESPVRPKAKSKGKSNTKLLPKVKSKKRKGYEEEGSYDEDDWPGLPQPLNLPRISFRVDDKHMIESFIYTRFTQIQQNALKVIAKTWIKAICPKKQANFPYVDCNPRHDQPRRKPRHNGPPRVPTFWPDLNLCRHREPDHLDKSERTYLLVHLMRLFWKQEDWQSSNGEASVTPMSIRVGNWVQFLQDSYPPEKLAEVSSSSPEQVKQRMQYLKDIYKVVLAEQEYLEGATDASATFTFAGDVRLIHPSGAQSRRQRRNAVSDGVRKVEDADEDAAPNMENAIPPTAGSTTSRRASVDSYLTEVQSSSDGTSLINDMASVTEHRPAPHSLVRSACSDRTSPFEPWTVSSVTRSVDGLADHKIMPAYSASGDEPATRRLELANNHDAYYGLPQYVPVSMQAGLERATVWGNSFGSSMGICADSQASYSNESTSGGSSSENTHPDDSRTLDPMLEGLSLRGRGIDTAPYGHEQNVVYGPYYGGMQPVVCATRPPDTQPCQELMISNGSLHCVEQQQGQYLYPGQILPTAIQALPSDMNYVMQMTNSGQGYIHDQAAPISDYRSF